jgi:replicative DNA helicase
MAGPGLGLLNKILIDKIPLGQLANVGLGPDDFLEEERTVYDVVAGHFEAYGKLPKTKTVEVESGVKFSKFPDEPLEYWVSRVRLRNTRLQIVGATEEIRDLAYKNAIPEARRRLQELVFELEMRDPTDRIHDVAEVARSVLEAHDVRQRTPGLGGVPFGMEYLDKISDGAQPGDTVAVVGRPSTGKTYLLLQLALNAWREGRPPLVLSLEMAPVQIVRRIVAMHSGVSTTRLRIGRLSTPSRKETTRKINEFAKLSKDTPFYLMQGSLTSTVEDLVLQVQEYRPAALYVDGAYMLRSRTRTQQRWERVAETAEVLKRIATEFSIPVIGSYQFNRRGPGSLGNIAFSDAVGQLASIVLGISDEDASPDEDYLLESYKIVQLIKGREGERGAIRVLYDMRRMRIRQDSVLRGYKEGTR